MDLEELRTFVEAARRGSFSEAARSLSLSQPAVSRRIRNLELEVGAPLFDRSGNVVTPTRRGLEFLTFAERTVSDWERLRPALSKEESVRGTLRIAASTTPGEYLLPDLMRSFLQKYREVKLSLHVMDSDTVEECVFARHCDIGFLGRLPRQKHLDHWLVAEDEIVLAVPSDHALAKSPEVHVEELEGAFVVERGPGSATHDTLLRLLAESGRKLPPYQTALTVSSAQAQLTAIAEGNGIGFVSDLALRYFHPLRVVSLRLHGIRLHRGLYMISNPLRKEQAESSTFSTFARYITQHART